MEQPTTTAKVKLFIEEALQKSETKFIEQLERGDLHGFEEALADTFQKPCTLRLPKRT